MTKTATMNQVVHFEIPYDDIEKAKEFYSIFDWELNDIPGMDYVGVRTTPVDENKMPTQPGAINGGLMKRTEQVKGPVLAVQVDMPKMEIPNMGDTTHTSPIPKTTSSASGSPSHPKPT